MRIVRKYAIFRIISTPGGHNYYGCVEMIKETTPKFLTEEDAFTYMVDDNLSPAEYVILPTYELS